MIIRLKEKTLFKNRDGVTYLFIVQENNTVLWVGPFNHTKLRLDSDKNITMVDPPGGPCIEKGDIINCKLIDKFETDPAGYKIILKKHEKQYKIQLT